MKDKVEISDSYITKFNTSQFSQGLEWATELLSINHNREIRVYSWYSRKSHQKLAEKILKNAKFDEENEKNQKFNFQSRKMLTIFG